MQIIIDQKQLENLEYFNYLGSQTTNDARGTWGNAVAKAAFNKKSHFASKWGLNLRTKPVKCLMWSIALYGAETSTFREVDQKYLEGFEVHCLRRMEKNSCADTVKN